MSLLQSPSSAWLIDAAIGETLEIDTRIASRAITHLQYYNGPTHLALFALPNFVRDMTVNAAPRPRLVASKRRA